MVRLAGMTDPTPGPEDETPAIDPEPAVPADVRAALLVGADPTVATAVGVLDDHVIAAAAAAGLIDGGTVAWDQVPDALAPNGALAGLDPVASAQLRAASAIATRIATSVPVTGLDRETVGAIAAAAADSGVQVTFVDPSTAVTEAPAPQEP